MGLEFEEFGAMRWIWVQAYLRDIMRSVPDYHNEASIDCIALKRIVIFLLVADLAYNFLKFLNLSESLCSQKRYSLSLLTGLVWEENEMTDV